MANSDSQNLQQNKRGRPKKQTPKRGRPKGSKKGSKPKCIKRPEKIYCGNKNYLPSKEYKRFGSREECLKRGFGSGMFTEREKIRELLKKKEIKFTLEKPIPYCN